MLSGLFKPAWQSSSAQKRLQAVQKLSAEESESLLTLESLAAEDPELEVRKAAIDKLPATSLFDLSNNHLDEDTQLHALTKFSELVGPKSSLTESELRTIVKSHPGAKPLICRLCPFPAIRHELLASVSDTELADLIAEIEYAESRQMIAEKLESLEHLEQARKALKGRDKVAERIVKSKIDALRAEQKQAEENRATAEDLCTKMEYMAGHEWREEFKLRYFACSSQWASLNFTPDDDLRQRYQQANSTVSLEAERQQQIDDTHSAQENLLTDIQTYCQTLAELSALEIVQQQQSIAEKHSQTQATWDQLSEIARANLHVADPFFLAQGGLESLLKFADSIAVEFEPTQPEEAPAADTTDTIEDTSDDTSESGEESIEGDAPSKPPNRTKVLSEALAALHWPNSFPALTAEGQVRERLTELKDNLRAEQKSHRENLDKLHKRINRIFGATKRGQIGHAKRELEAVTRAAVKYSGREKATLDERIEQATETVTKMGDWKDFATEPKYVELCEAMEALRGSDKHPDKLAEDISALQKQWKALGFSDSSEKHWERFKAAGDKAYEPCAKFFQERNERRKQNLESRDPLIAEAQVLLESTDWDGQPDYKGVEVALRRISDNWKKIKDVDPRAGQKQWKQFCKVRDEVYDKLRPVYEANIALKEQLVEQAQAMCETEVSEQSLTSLQQLQSRWKQVGVTRRKEDQAVWKKFKQATDDVYAKIQGVRQSKRDEENQQLDGYRSIVKQIHQLAKAAKDLAEADHSFERLQANYQALPPLPKNLAEKMLDGLQKDYKHACDAYARSRDKILEAASKEELNALSEKARLCTELEKLAGAEGSEEDVHRLQEEISAIELQDRALQKRFDERLSAATQPDKSEATERRRLLCIELEILLGVDSPEEDREHRMAMQFERMEAQGLGRSTADKSAVVEELKIDWLCLPGATPSVQIALDKRFKKLAT